MTVINYSIAHGGQNMIKLGTYAESNNSMHWCQCRLKPTMMFEMSKDDMFHMMNDSRANITCRLMSNF